MLKVVLREVAKGQVVKYTANTGEKIQEVTARVIKTRKNAVVVELQDLEDNYFIFKDADCLVNLVK
jgi:hypothetical protein